MLSQDCSRLKADESGETRWALVAVMGSWWMRLESPWVLSGR
jgi:hypothetical protein